MIDRDDNLEAIDPLAESTAPAVDPGVPNVTKGGPRARLPTRATVLLVAVTAVFGAVVGGAVEWRFRADPGRSRQPAALPLQDSQQTIVPNVFGLSPWAAEKMLAQSGLASSVYERDRPFLTEKSVVIAQEPGAGQRVAVGSIVGLRTLRDEVFSDTPLRPDKPAPLGSPQNREYPWVSRLERLTSAVRASDQQNWPCPWSGSPLLSTTRGSSGLVTRTYLYL